MARATVLAEGTWGHLTGAAIREFDLARNREPQVWALGVKEVWEVARPLDRVIHTLGWPLRYGAKYHEFGGSWIYPMGERPGVSIGFVVGLDYADATVSAHDLLQQFKHSKLVRGVLEGGKRVAWGAKAIPEGGYWAMPKLSAPGMVLAGDGAGMVNVPILKGIHYAIHAGIMAADAIFAALKAGGADLSSYEDAVENSLIGRELYQTRNMKQPFAQGLLRGWRARQRDGDHQGAVSGWPLEQPPRRRRCRCTSATSARATPSPTASTPSTSSPRCTSPATRPATTRRTTSACARRSPARSPRCGSGCARRACTRCPRTRPRGNVDVIVNYTNCVQCGAITAKGGRLTAPEGGDGPLYTHT